jgi:hypothetical protein
MLQSAGQWKAKRRSPWIPSRSNGSSRNTSTKSSQSTDPRGLFGVCRVVFEQMAVVAHKSAAATGRLYDGFGTCLDSWPPGIDIAPGAFKPFS